MGDDYLIEISTKKYNEKMLAYEVYLCNHCTMDLEKVVNKGEDNERKKIIQVPTETPTFKIKPFKLIMPLIDSVLMGSDTVEAWICPSCKKDNKLNETHKIIPEREHPFFLKVIWDCPIRVAGISNKFGFEEKFNKWFWNFLEEINWQEVLYRKEYSSQHDGAEMGTYTGTEDAP